MNRSSLLVLGLNPAWQRLFLLDRLVPGKVHRLPKAIEFASGKGINFCRVLSRLGSSSHCIQFLAGTRGHEIQKELDLANLGSTSISLSGETRICTTYSSMEGESTEFIEPSPTVTEADMDHFIAKIFPIWEDAESVVVCGTAPAGFDWSRVAPLSLQNKKMYLDAWTGVEGWLKSGVELLKVNGEELAQLLGMQHDAECLDVFDMAKRALQNYSLRHLVVTQGSRRVLVFSQNSYLTLCPPRPIPFVNAIGAGDAFLAGWMEAVQKGYNVRGCLTKAVSVSVARCEVALPWEIDLAKVSRLETELSSRVEENPWTF